MLRGSRLVEWTLEHKGVVVIPDKVDGVQGWPVRRVRVLPGPRSVSRKLRRVSGFQVRWQARGYLKVKFSDERISQFYWNSPGAPVTMALPFVRRDVGGAPQRVLIRPCSVKHGMDVGSLPSLSKRLPMQTVVT